MTLIRQQAFVEKRKMLKGGLHCHTTRSDGHGTPEEVIRLHYTHGYDFLSLTDHFIYNYKNFAPEVPITILPGMELSNMLEKNWGFRFFDHVCLGPAREDGNGIEQDELFEETYAKDYNEYQPVLDDIHARNNITILAHPEWSGTPAGLFAGLKGNFAMEIWNSGSVMSCDMDADAAYWDELLDAGQKIYGVATDDGHAMKNHCLGWVMVNAENNIPSILQALKNGAFYSSCGPEIYDFYVEDGKAVIKCSDVDKIRLHCMKHPIEIVRRTEGPLTTAEFSLGVDYYKYVRISVVDSAGRKAWTNPIFLV